MLPWERLIHIDQLKMIEKNRIERERELAMQNKADAQNTKAKLNNFLKR